MPVDLDGNEYEAMIPGTKCPVSAGILENWYWKEGLAQRDISERVENLYAVHCAQSTIGDWLRLCGIKRRPSSNYGKKAAPQTFKKERNNWIRSEEGRAHLLKNQKKASLASARKKGKEAAVYSECLHCGVEFKHIRCKKRLFCSISCRNRHLGQRNKSRSQIKELICPTCFSCLRLAGFTGCKSYRKFMCPDCHKETNRPVIEFGLRQDLEAAGMIDNGRILAEAF